jgi:hypothetical protein
MLPAAQFRGWQWVALVLATPVVTSGPRKTPRLPPLYRWIRDSKFRFFPTTWRKIRLAGWQANRSQ